MEERRRSDDKNWDEIKSFIKDQSEANQESRDYRCRDEVIQKYQAEKLESLDARVMIQNGRIVKLEKRAEETDAKIKQRKDNYAQIQAWITIIATIVMGLSAWITIMGAFKKGG